jgi:hypothetical protein
MRGYEAINRSVHFANRVHSQSHGLHLGLTGFVVDTSIAIQHARGTCRMMTREHNGVISSQLCVQLWGSADDIIYPVVTGGHPQVMLCIRLDLC